MASPFSTIEAFSGAIEGPTQGAIYTFAQTPAINHIALVISGLLFAWFMVRLGKGPSKSTKFEKSLNKLTLLVMVGLLSFVGPEDRHPQRHGVAPSNAGHEYRHP